MGRKRLRTATLAATAVVAACAGLWVGIHEIPWLGTFLADTTRAVVGPSAVARVEDAAYGVQDAWNRAWHGDDEPEAFWEVPEAAAATSPTPLPAASSGAPAAQSAGAAGSHGPPASLPFRPQPVGPMLAGFSAKGDGVWVAMPSKRWPDEPPRLYKTLLHPDRKRPWTAVAIVAIDLQRVDLHLKAGKYVPEATEPEGRRAKRPAVVPPEHTSSLIAAFNGGFKTIHGRPGMHVDGVTLISPNQDGCTVAKGENGNVAIGTWKARFGDSDDLLWWRQAPACLVEDGAFGEGVLYEANMNWGASVHGSTYIRRSSIGVDRTGHVLYVGIGDAISASALAKAMKHAGAHDVAQLDVNWTLPKFLTYEPRGPDGRLEPEPLYEGLQYVRDEYVRAPAPRDFFYVTRRPG
ncbi:MAG: hypothetical protein ACOC1F_03195 [Myxococcota bacterium]